MFDYFSVLSFFGKANHNYTLNLRLTTGKSLNYTYSTREQAKQKMYDLCKKYDLSVTTVWDDHHFKTYKCSDGSCFHINRI